jgi:hypothetical protein
VGFIRRDTRDRRQVLAGLEGRWVTVIAGFRVATKRTGRLFVADKADLVWGAGLCRASIVLEDDRRERWFPMSEVYEVIDPDTGATLGGPWR